MNKPTSLIKLGLSFLLGTSLIACGGGNTDNPNAEGHTTLTSSLQRDTAPNVSDSDFDALTSGSRSFGLELYQALEKDQDNVLISPLSIRTAFGLLHAGAAGNTESDIETGLHFNLGGEAVYPAMNKLGLELEARNWPGNADKDPVELYLANNFWSQEGYPWKDTYLDRIMLHYGAGIETLDFQGEPDASRVIINDFVQDFTRDKIKDLLPQGSIKRSTVAVLTNALYFKAPWANAFEDFATSDQSFTNLDGSTSTVKLMSQTEWGNYYEDEQVQALELDYANNELSMVFILPQEGEFADFETSMTVDDLDAIIDNLTSANGTIQIPRFTFESGYQLKQPLSEMGMTSIFASADLSEMIDNGSLLVDDVYHKTFIAVDEQGTEAAAATAIVVGETSAPMEEFQFRADRPFFIAIRDKVTGTFLFFGRVASL